MRLFFANLFHGLSPPRKKLASFFAPPSSEQISQPSQNSSVNLRPSRLMLLVAGAGLIVQAIIAGNALWLQKGPHPAPLFSNPSDSPRFFTSFTKAFMNFSGPSSGSLSPPQEALFSSHDSLSLSQLIQKTSVPNAESPSNLLSASHPQQDSGSDPIGQLLQNLSLSFPDAPIDIRPVIDKLPARTILSIQKALHKLHYPIKVDGHWGESTQQALAQFSPGQSLFISGDINKKILQNLSSMTGIKIECGSFCMDP